jgi:hypothetical protein
MLWEKTSVISCFAHFTIETIPLQFMPRITIYHEHNMGRMMFCTALAKDVPWPSTARGVVLLHVEFDGHQHLGRHYQAGDDARACQSLL